MSEGGAVDVVLTHPELPGFEKRVTERQALIWEKSGWQRQAFEPEPVWHEQPQEPFRDQRDTSNIEEVE